MLNMSTSPRLFKKVEMQARREEALDDGPGWPSPERAMDGDTLGATVHWEYGESAPGKAVARRFSGDAIAFNDADWPFSTAWKLRSPDACQGFLASIMLYTSPSYVETISFLVRQPSFQFCLSYNTPSFIRHYFMFFD